MSKIDLVLGIALVLSVFFWVACSMDKESHSQPAPEGLGSVSQTVGIELNTRNYVNDTGDNAGGLSSGPGIQIHWSGLGNESLAEPLGVLKLTAGRLSHLQSTPQASDSNARALIEVLEAIDALEGTNEVSAPVGPGFIEPEN